MAMDVCSYKVNAFNTKLPPLPSTPVEMGYPRPHNNTPHHEHPSIHKIHGTMAWLNLKYPQTCHHPTINSNARTQCAHQLTKVQLRSHGFLFGRIVVAINRPIASDQCNFAQFVLGTDACAHTPQAHKQIFDCSVEKLGQKNGRGFNQST